MVSGTGKMLGHVGGETVCLPLAGVALREAVKQA